MLQLDNSLLHIVTGQGQPADRHYRGSAQLQLERRLHHKSKGTPSHLLQFKRHSGFLLQFDRSPRLQQEKVQQAKLTEGVSSQN